MGISRYPALDLFLTSLVIVVMGLAIGVREQVANRVFATRPVIDHTLCPVPADQECTLGLVLTAAGGEKVCDFAHQVAGSACNSRCYVSGTATHCNANQQCVSDDSTNCLGYCPTGGHEWGDGTQCQGKLAFKNFFNESSANRSSDYLNQLFYTSYPPDCYASAGCVWYSAILRFYSRNDTIIKRTSATQYPSCLGVLDASKTATECIDALELRLSDKIANLTYFSLAFLAEDDEILDHLDTYYFDAVGCVYSYKCAPMNTTFYSMNSLGLTTEPTPNKRQLIQEFASPLTLRMRYQKLFLQHAAAMRDQLKQQFNAISRNK